MILRVVRVFGVVKTDGQGMVLGDRSYEGKRFDVPNEVYQHCPMPRHRVLDGYPRNGYRWSVAGTKVSLIVRALTQRIKFR